MKGFILFCFFLVGCSANYFQTEVLHADDFIIESYQINEGKYDDISEEMSLDPSLLEEYDPLIGDKDIIKVDFYHPVRKDAIEEIRKINASLFEVKGHNIQMPLVGEIRVQGLTLPQAKEKIQQAYRCQLADIEVFVQISSRPGSKVEIMGLAKRPEIEVDGKMRLFEVLAKAQIDRSANLYKSYIVRDGKILPINFCKLIKEGDVSQNIVVRPKDKIYIAEAAASNIVIFGEVGSPMLIPVPDGKISLREALATAKGMQLSADPFAIYVIRGAFSIPKIYRLSFQQILQLPQRSLLLIPGDILYVGPSAITDWNRWISQILPTIRGIATFGKAVDEVKKIP